MNRDSCGRGDAAINEGEMRRVVGAAIESRGCSDAYEELQKCLAANGRDWRTCQAEVKAWKTCFQHQGKDKATT